MSEQELPGISGKWKRIKLTKGKFAIVDAGDYNKLSQFSWHYSADGYAARGVRINGKNVIIKMHRSLLKVPKGTMVDHVNREKLDNRKANLRVCNKLLNAINAPKRRDNISGFKGVTFFKRNSKWKAQIQVNGKNIHLGHFSSAIEAAKAYNNAARKYFGKYAYLNKL